MRTQLNSSLPEVISDLHYIMYPKKSGVAEFKTIEHLVKHNISMNIKMNEALRKMLRSVDLK